MGIICNLGEPANSHATKAAGTLHQSTNARQMQQLHLTIQITVLSI
jgi:hypothetical protein